jgi:3-oxoacyl-[acyl-carrier-protein] synthase III
MCADSMCVLGVGHAAPAVSISNKDMEKIVETTGEWIQTRTGIENRLYIYIYIYVYIL